MFNKNTFSIILALMSCSIYATTANSNHSVSSGSPQDLLIIQNSSPAYLNFNTGDPTCPTSIPPGASVTISPVWCGYIACSTSGYTSDGCMERVSATNPSLVNGGYLGWLSISMSTSACAVSGAATTIGTNPYSCTVKKVDNNYVFNFQYQSLIQYYTYGVNAGKIVTIPKPTVYKSIPYRGINISGLEYNGTYGDALFQFPDIPDVRYFIEQGMNTVRLPIRLEYWFSDNSGVGSTLGDSHIATTADGTKILPKYPNSIYIAAVTDLVNKYLSHGINVILDLHNYMRFCPTGVSEGQGNEPTDPVTNNCTILSQYQISDAWTKIATNFQPLANTYKTQLMFGVSNEPFGQPDQPLINISTTSTDTTLFSNEVAAVKAIRLAGIQDNLVILSGNYWDPLHGWENTPTDGSGGQKPTANSETFTQDNLTKAGVDTSKIAIEVHQYFDNDYSGRSEVCKTYKDYSDFSADLNLTSFTTWMQNNNMKVLLTEFGAADNATCQTDIEYMFKYIETNTYTSSANGGSGFIGWTAWRANRHATASGYGAFNYLNQSDDTVYNSSATVLGISQGMANPNMSAVFANHLTTPVSALLNKY